MITILKMEEKNVLESKGKMFDDNDILIAGIIIMNGVKKILTRNVQHFKNIENIIIIKY